MADVVMPRLSDSMEEGTILKWLVAPGGVVRRGQPLVEIETDKATETCEAEAEGVLEVIAAEGETVRAGALIARIGGDDAPDDSAGAGPAPTDTARGEVTRIEPTRARASLARRVAEARATVPELTLTRDVDLEQATALRSQLEALHPGVPAPTHGDMVVKACGLALRDFPAVNGAWRDGRFERYGRVNVGVTVAGPDAPALPTVFDADRRPLLEIAATRRTLAERAAAGELTAPEVGGATFSITEAAVGALVPIITPPHAAALGMGAASPRPVAIDGTVGVRPVTTLTLVCDHRVLDAAQAAAFLARVGENLESPAALLL